MLMRKKSWKINPETLVFWNEQNVSVDSEEFSHFVRKIPTLMIYNIKLNWRSISSCYFYLVRILPVVEEKKVKAV